MITIVVADDQALIRAGLRAILDNEPDLSVVGEAQDGAEAADLVRRLTPDVVLMDIRMPDMDGIEATRIITGAGVATRVLILTTFDLDEYVYGAFRAGASGFMLKDAPRDQLIAAVRVVADGEALLAPALTRRLIERFVMTQPESPPEFVTGELSERELEVLRRIALGHSNAEIATSLVISHATVKTHVGSILRKLNVRDRVQAVVYAYESGLCSPLTAYRRAEPPLSL